MTDRQLQTILISAVVFGAAYAVLSQPRCQEACRAFFKPLETEAGKTLASVLLAGLFGSAI
jgi:hypothetical protein